MSEISFKNINFSHNYVFLFRCSSFAHYKLLHLANLPRIEQTNQHTQDKYKNLQKAATMQGFVRAQATMPESLNTTKLKDSQRLVLYNLTDCVLSVKMLF